MKEIKEIFSPANEKSAEISKARGREFCKVLESFEFEKPTTDVPITYYVLGYISRQLITSSSCDSCKSSLLSDKQENLSVNVDEALATAEDLAEGKMFIELISRGGLVKPSVMFVSTLAI